MNGRRSLQPGCPKPYNINIYYNINSKNITNNHEVQSHPVTARLPKSDTNSEIANPKLLQTKLKTTKTRRKKLSVDLSGVTEKKMDKFTKKSNTNSICSGFGSQAQPRKDDRQEEGKRSQGVSSVERNQQKLGQLLQIFSEGKIDKTKLTKEILQIFEQAEQPKDKKIAKKKRSVSTLVGISTTPRNQLLQRPILNIHKARKKQSKSERSSFESSKKNVLKNDIMEKIIICKNIDSSLCLQPEEDEAPLIVDRTQDIDTTSSVMLLNQNLQLFRKKYGNQPDQFDTVNAMAIRIQRAWRKYRTDRIIKNLLRPLQKNQLNSLDSQIQKLECLSLKKSLSVQHFLSQQLNRRHNQKQTQIARVDQLRDHQLKKWNQIMDYVKVSMSNRALSSDQCLHRIIQYFQNAKKTVQSQLMFDKGKGTQDSVEGRDGIGGSRHVEIGGGRQEQDQQQEEDQEEEQEEEEEDGDLDGGKGDVGEIQEYEEIIEEQPSLQEQQKLFQTSSSAQINNKLMFDRLVLHKPGAQKSQQLSLQVIESTLVNHLKKLESEYNKKLKLLDLQSPNYLQSKKQLEVSYKSAKKEIKTIITNLNKGYIEAKNILEKDVLQSDQSNIKSASSRDNLQKCKSDNYLLKTAINYKKYIERKQSNENSPEPLGQPIKQLTKARLQDNLEMNSVDSSELSTGKIRVNERQENEFLENRSSLFDIDREGGEGLVISNKDPKQTKLQQHIISQQFLQYEQIPKKMEQDEQRSQIQLSVQNSQTISQQKPDEISLIEHKKLNQLNKKLKYLTNQDKDDIFQFVFIDVTLEIVLQCQLQSTVYAAIRKYLERKKKLESIPRGVKTCLQFCKEYLNQMCMFIITDFSHLYFKNITVPMGPTAREMLRYMHEDDPDAEPQDSTNAQESVPIILPVSIFHKNESIIKHEYPQFYDDEAKETMRKNFLRSVEHIHHKALFDCLNESLDTERPFGIWGVPFPWKTSQKSRREVTWSTDAKVDKLKSSVNKVIQNCSYLCGILADKQNSLLGNRFSQSYVTQIRQDRMSKMLSNQEGQSQQKWSFHDDQQTEICIEVAKQTFIGLIVQFAKQIRNTIQKLNSQ